MDLDAKAYSTDELIAALGVRIPRQDLKLLDLQICLNKKLEGIENLAENSLQYSKKDLTIFFQNAFLRIMTALELHKTPDFISVQEGLLPPLEPTAPVQQGGSVVIQHVNHQPTESFPTSVAPGLINPLTRKSYKKLLNINTKFRRDYQMTKSTDFIIELPETVKKVASMKLTCTEFPKTVYTFAQSLGSNYFRIRNSSASDWTLIEIPDGSYPPAELAQTITTVLLPTFPDVSVSFNFNTGKITFESSSGTFALNFNYIEDKCPVVPSNIDRNQMTLGWLLGFRGDAIKVPEAQKQYQKKKTDWIQWNSKCCSPPYENPTQDPSNVYPFESQHVGEGIFSGHGTPYFLLSINDFNNNHNEVLISPFKDQSLADGDVIAKISTSCCGGCTGYPARIYFGPVDIRRLHIKLFDEYGRLVEINNADYSLTLELERIYDL